ncbi:MAG: 23S rRNA (adenine(2503)-C(2))-methyltransferase RlmN [Phoenicibacter congonensis]|uniref:Probable dual-specificity RNA methyltransferase RlmN n=1 Tax=Phoenicibacter congonensis TaxID=1944646 RepID=A0AA43RHV1_9ACTN|nr:23S rRNA (adenine(2503)-C(2))-methyltransferase RlmN [Phoenicibacter congonensis]
MSKEIKNDDIFELSFEEVQSLIEEVGEKKFRAKQVYEWLHNHPISSYDDMNNVPKSLRQKLSEKYPMDALEIRDIQESVDGTKKYLFNLKDGNVVESVLIPNSDGRITACISTQVGCSMNCAFCATGSQGLTRNLSAQEIVFQLAQMTKDSGERFSNVVVMGQGEPFLNYDNTLKAIRQFNSDEAYKIAARKITVSTCGIIDGIEKFLEEPEQFGLAISLHSAVQATRNVIMPKTKNMPLNSLSAAISDYIEKSNRRVTLEYMLLKDVNDDDAHLAALIDFCNHPLLHINLLQFNEVDSCEFKSAGMPVLKHFENELTKNGVPCSIRCSKGSDIDGACGQLANKTKVAFN